MKTLASLLPNSYNSQVHTEAVISAIGELQPQKAHIVGIFSELFPALREAIKRGVPRKAILRELDANGVKLNAVNFKKLYEAEELKNASGAERERS